MRNTIAAGLLFALGTAAAAAADDHILLESRRTYMGRTYPPQTSEIWIASDKTYAREGAVVTIERYDLGKRWRIDTQAKTYLEEALASPMAAAPKADAPSRFQELGWEYVPDFVWTGALTKEEKRIDGLPCRKAVLTGTAEYAEEARELWLAKDVPIDIRRYYQRIVQPALSGSLARVFAKTAALRDRLPLRTTVTQDPPIAGRTVWETALTKVEVARPPDGVYDLPPGLEKAANRDDWLRR
jgi:hypothetical protein